MKRTLFFLLLALIGNAATAQNKVVPIKWGDMEHWTVRQIKESKIIGGKVKTLYVLGPTDTIGVDQPKAYQPEGRTPWGISNAYANIMGVSKAANTTRPEKRGKGWCARLETQMEDVRVVGLVDIHVCVSGTLFLGQTLEPVRNINDPYSKTDMGIPFTEKPQALMIDLKTLVSDSKKVTKALGMKTGKIDGHDEPEICIFLQQRREDEKGNIYAKRIGTLRQRFPESISEWRNDYQMPIHYGDITKRSDFKPYQGLFGTKESYKALNSKGEMVTINEVAWGNAEDTPTHIMLIIKSGCYPAFCGTVGNTLWVDNVRLVY